MCFERRPSREADWLAWHCFRSRQPGDADYTWLLSSRRHGLSAGHCIGNVSELPSSLSTVAIILMLRAPRLLAPYHRRCLQQQLRLQRNYATVTDLARLPQVGDELHGFTVKRREHIPELELSALHFQHQKTGAEYLHVARDDSNNVFSIGFKTNPPDATGVPHILEHVTLCGSEK